MRRSLAFIAVGVAVAIAAAVIVAGMSSNGGETAGASDEPAGALPTGHPSVAVDQDDAAGRAETEEDADPGSAIAGLQAKLDEAPGDVAVLLDLGNAYFMAQRLPQAEQAYSQVLALEPKSAAGQVGLAMVWHAQGDSKRAESALRTVIEEHPDDQDAHYSLAIVTFSVGRIGEAKAQWQTAARIDPTSTTGRRSQSFVDLLEDQESGAPEAND